MQTTEELKYRNPARPLTRGPFLDRRGFFPLSLSFFFSRKNLNHKRLGSS